MKLGTILIAAAMATALAFGQATRVVTTDACNFTESFDGQVGPTRISTLDDPQLLWSRNLATGIFYSTAITNSIYAYSGSGLNAPREAAQYAIMGDGTPFMSMEGYEWEVASAPNGGYWAAVNRDSATISTLYLMVDSTGAPAWTYPLGFGAVAGNDGMQFSSDGNILVLYMTRAPNYQPRLLAWDLSIQDTVPLLDYEIPAGEGTYGRVMEMSSDGSIIACTADNYCHIIETVGGIVRDVVDFQASSDALAFSADGNWLMSGFQAARLYRWDGDSYVMQWQAGLNGRYCAQLMISPDTTYCVSCWYSSSYDRNYIRVHDITTGYQIWSYSYRQGTGYQDWPVDVDITDDGNWFAVGSWGDQGSQNGEAVVFSRWYPTPYYELDMAGSCFSLDLSSYGRYLIAGGKHVHANQFGNGGDLSVVDLDNADLGPIVQVIDTFVTFPDTVCFCQDTVLLTPRIANVGYGPLTLLNTFTVVILDDSSYVAVDTSQWGLSIEPGDTVEINAWYAPCSWFAGTFWLGINTSAADSMSIACIVPYDHCTGAKEPPTLQPVSFALIAYPNPFNPTTTIDYSLPGQSDVHLVLTDILGREVDKMGSRHQEAGVHHVTWNAHDLPTGIYFARLDSRYGTRIQKLMLLR